MVARKREAQEWLNAWGQPTPKSGNGNGAAAQANNAGQAMPIQPEEPPFPIESDTPF